ncbi:Putative F-box protein At1g53370 [Linum grandiflorum]
MCFFPADSHLNVHGIKRIQSSVTCLGPVRGLVCLVDRGAVQLFNVGTGEVTPWLMPEMVKHYSPSRRPRFFFGFDPSSRKHKVLCMRGAFKPHGATSHYEVLTLGEEDSRWRIIDDEPPYQLSTDMVAYANGSIYSLVRTEWFESVVAFDFGSEKFRKIPNPTFTRLEEEEVDTTECSKKEKVVRRRYKAANRFHRDQFPYHDGIIEMDWCLTLIRRRYRTVKIWKFHDSDKKENGTSSENEEWSLVKDIKLPDDITSDVFVYFHPEYKICPVLFVQYDKRQVHQGKNDWTFFSS